jgi:hypothetical protein
VVEDPPRLVAVTFDAHDPVRVAQFWAGMLARDVMATNAGAMLPGDATQLGLGFALSGAEKAGPNRMHLHLTSTSLDDQQGTVARALRLGGRPLDVGQHPDEGHIVLADPGGNEFCVLEPGNSFLAGCGLLGELACEGSREVGLFWREVLDWPLVWDQDQETAIQSRHGGTKVAWGGPRVAPPVPTTKQRFDLVPTAGDQESEAERLISLGARRLAVDEGDDKIITLADPDGNEFRLLSHM